MKWLVIIPWLASASIIGAADATIPTADPVQIEHGRYLVERVGMCGDCHSPRNDRGEFDGEHWLQGAVLGFKPEHPMPFAAIAPPIAGLPSYATDDMALRFLETGTNSLGKLALPPMPQFRFSHEDALAVVAYLRSLKK
jgi:hypothetical protein